MTRKNLICEQLCFYCHEELDVFAQLILYSHLINQKSTLKHVVPNRLIDENGQLKTWPTSYQLKPESQPRVNCRGPLREKTPSQTLEYHKSARAQSCYRWTFGYQPWVSEIDLQQSFGIETNCHLASSQQMLKDPRTPLHIRSLSQTPVQRKKNRSVEVFPDLLLFSWGLSASWAVILWWLFRNFETTLKNLLFENLSWPINAELKSCLPVDCCLISTNFIFCITNRLLRSGINSKCYYPWLRINKRRSALVSGGSFWKLPKCHPRLQKLWEFPSLNHSDLSNPKV